MLESDIVSELLETFSDGTVARKRAKEIKTLRGVRGVPTGEIARVGAAVWSDQSPSMDDEAELDRLFGTAFEDGLIAIGLLAAILPDEPADAFHLGRDWADRLDEHQTADALGQLVLGPGVLATGADPTQIFATLIHHRRPAARRAVVMAALAMMPEEAVGPAVAPLRARVGTAGVVFVDAPVSPTIQRIVDALFRDQDAGVRKAIRRVLTAWSVHDPDYAEQWLNGVKGGVPKMYREAMTKAIRKGRRLQAAQNQSEA